MMLHGRPAAYPHAIVHHALRARTRVSVFWTLFFILLIYLTIPALAVLVKYDIYSALVGSNTRTCPPGCRTGPMWTNSVP